MLLLVDQPHSRAFSTPNTNWAKNFDSMGIKERDKSLLWTSREIGMDAERFEKGGECDLPKSIHCIKFLKNT